MLSKAMQEVIDRLQGDWDFIEWFLDAPQEALADYSLT